MTVKTGDRKLVRAFKMRATIGTVDLDPALVDHQERFSSPAPDGSGHAMNGCWESVSDTAVYRHQQFRDLPFAIGSEPKF